MIQLHNSYSEYKNFINKDIISVSLIIRADNYHYNFFIQMDGKEIELGKAQTKYLSSEVAGGFTGVFIGLYACSKNSPNIAEFKNFKCQYI